MTSYSRRLERLESAFAPRGKPFIIWGMADGQALRSDREIETEIAAARSSGRMAVGDQPVIVSWRRP
jgi:hypothetical protein